jgi:hypothetical protein
MTVEPFTGTGKDCIVRLVSRVRSGVCGRGGLQASAPQPEFLRES